MENEVMLRSQEIKEANNKLVQANDRLKELDRLKTDFFANISHEFRTPLTLIMGPVADLISTLDPGQENSKNILETVHRNCLRLLKLVNNLLDFSKLEAGRAKMFFEVTDLGTLTSDLASTFRSAIERASLKLIVNCEALRNPVYVDREMWEKIVLNLISNAFKYTLKGEICVTLKSDGNFVELSVADTGTGIPENEIGKIFERFHRVQGSQGRTHEGTGIGLALVHELVKLHGGTAEVKSRLGQGTTFIIRIPFGSAHLSAERVSKVVRSLEASEGQSRAFIEEANRWTADSPVAKGPAASSGTKKHVLVADDNADMREYVTKLLAEKYELTAVANGKEALDAIRQGGYDLLISDIMMPVMDGNELLRTIRADRKFQNLPVILLSARAGEEARASEVQLGADDYLTKPFSATELISRVHTQINLSQMRAKLLKDLENANQELESFSYSVSHDLRSPLRSMVGFGKILLEEHPESQSEEGKKLVQRIIQAGQRMGLLIDSLLSLSKISRSQIHFSPVNLSKIAQTLRDEILEANPGAKTHFIIRADMEVSGDPQLLELVLQNLINNAFKFTSKLEAPEIQIGIQEVNGEKVYFVKDNGAGFDMQYVGKLFGTFQRLHSETEFAGTGIGLATVRRIIHRHGGRIWAEGAIGKGATFFFTVPGLELKNLQ